MEDRLLNAAQVGQRLGLSEWTVWKLGREGRLPAIRIGRQMRFRLADLTAFETANQIPTATTVACR